MTKIIIFGASGDLARRKLIPAISYVNNKDVEIIGYSRTDLGHNFAQHLSRFHEYDQEFLKKLSYISGDYYDLQNIDNLLKQGAICYLSVPPSVYILAIDEIKKRGGKVIAMEKPFGSNAKEFEKIKRITKDAVDIHFIDHYLYKPMTVALSKIYSVDETFNDFVCGENIKSIEIYFKEDIGSEGRGYFDMSGLIRDVVQNHVAEILGTFTAKKEKLRSSLLKGVETNNYNDWRLGQYDDYQAEIGKESLTETFSFMVLFFKAMGWNDIPFIIMAGKGMNEKLVEVRANLSDVGVRNVNKIVKNFNELEGFLNNKPRRVSLVVNYSPSNAIYLEIENLAGEILRHDLYSNETIQNLMKEQYENLTEHEIVFDSLIKQKEFPGVQLDEVTMLWKIFDPEEYKKLPIFNYKKGTNVPEEIKPLIDKYINGRKN